MNYLITIVINDIQKTFTSQSLQYDGEYYYIPREHFGLDCELKLPLCLEDGKWFVRSVNKTSDDTLLGVDNEIDPIADSESFLVNNIYSSKNISLIAMIDGKIIKEKEVSNNDLFAIFDKVWNLHYSIIFKNTVGLNLKAEFFEIKKSQIIVGKAETCDIKYNFRDLVLDEHFLVEFANGEAFVRSKSVGNGYVSSAFYVNGKNTTKAHLKYGDIISLRDLTIVFLDKYLGIYATDIQISSKALEYKSDITQLGVDADGQDSQQNRDSKFITRVPRKANRINDERIEIELPPQPTVSKKMPAILTIGPSLTMSMAMLVSVGVSVTNVLQGGNKATLITSGALALSMLLGALLWPLLTRAYQKKQDRIAEDHRQKKYGEYLAEIEQELELKTKSNLSVLNHELFLSPQEILSSFNDTKKLQQYLYEKQQTDSDFLQVRMGSGAVKNPLGLTISPKKFSLYEDVLRDNAYKLFERFSVVPNTPVTLSLANKRVVGIVNEEGSADNVFRTLLMSLTYCHAYNEVKTVFVFNEYSKDKFEWVKNIPHTISDSEDESYVATNRNEAHQLLTHLNEVADLRESNTEEQTPHFVIFVFDVHLIENEMFVNRIINSESNLGFTFVYVSSEKALPKECDAVVDNDQDGYYIYRSKQQSKSYFIPDTVAETEWNAYYEKLRGYKLKVTSKISNIPEKLSFLDMYQVGNVNQLNIAKRWKENIPYKSMAAPVGVKTGGELYSLDMHESYHGPHGLAAGMTGSGKSEFLQTLILSLAINYSPDDVSFVIIDFKGGGMANSFKGLPHLAGTMTNLSGNELNRAMVTIQSETARRQQKFKDYSVNHIDKYQKLYAENRDKMDPLPHLIIIADEFAELKSQQPEFMKQLIELARIGRSLGIHLLLATQKPAGVVDDQIWGNSRFRVCLKVLEKQDSNEMIRRPDAALIKLPGRCYLQVGYDEVFEYFQSGYSGVPYVHQEKHHDVSEDVLMQIDSCGSMIAQASIKTNTGSKNYTQLNAVVDEIKRVSLEEGFSQRRLWLDPLPKKLSLDKLMQKCHICFDGMKWGDNAGYSAVIGMMDDPASQRQMSLDIDFSKGNYGVYGVTGCGKSNVLQALIYSLCSKYSPTKIQFDILDFSSRTLGSFANMPHVNNLVYSDDESKVRDVITSLVAEIEHRNKMFGERGVSSLEAFNNSGSFRLPMIVLVIDNYSIISERYNNLVDKIVKIVRSGCTYGVCTIITATARNVVYSRIADCLTNCLAMRLTDKLTYRELMRTSNIAEIEDCPGRGLVLHEKKALEFQSALVGGISSDADRTATIKKVATEMAAVAIANNLVSSKKAETIQTANEPIQETTAEGPILLDGANDMMGTCITRPVNSAVPDNANELLVGFLNEKQFLLPLETLKTLFVLGDEREKNHSILQNYLLQFHNLGKQVFVFNTNDDLEVPNGVRNYSFADKSVSKGITELFATIKARDADNIVVIISDLPKFFELLDDSSGLKLGTLTGASQNKRACFVVEGNVRGIGQLTGCEIGANLRRDKRSRGVYVNKYFEDDIIFENVREISTMKALSLTGKQGFIVGETCMLCDLEGLR